MGKALSSRERMLAAINLQEPDYSPLWVQWAHKPTQILDWTDPVDRAEKVLDMGLDETVRIDVPFSVHPDVTSKVWVEHPTDSRYPLIHKEWSTPKGVIKQVVQKTPDWEAEATRSDDLKIMDDWNVPRSLEFPVKDLSDLEKLDYLYQPPTSDQMAQFEEMLARAKELDRRRGLLIEGGWVWLGDLLFWLLGAQGVVLAQTDKPELVEALLDRAVRWDDIRINRLLDAGVDVITQRAWYESTDFWGLRGFRRFLKPLLRERVERVHSAGAKMIWICTTGDRHRLSDLIDAGVDVLWGVDPVQDKTADLPLFKQMAQGKLCLSGGVNGQVTLVEGTTDDVREEVRTACRILGPGGGFYLSPIDNVYKYTPRANLEAMIDEWRRVRGG